MGSVKDELSKVAAAQARINRGGVVPLAEALSKMKQIEDFEFPAAVYAHELAGFQKLAAQKVLRMMEHLEKLHEDAAAIGCEDTRLSYQYLKGYFERELNHKGVRVVDGLEAQRRDDPIDAMQGRS